MKKLQNLGRSMSKNEQKKIIGGVFDSSDGTYTCTATPKPGYTVTSPGACTGSLVNCNTEAATWCTNTTGCASCTCT